MVRDGDDPALPDPNGCATCEYKRGDTGSGWCYMFREEPEPLCMQHQDRRHLRPPPKIGIALALAHVLGVEAPPNWRAIVERASRLEALYHNTNMGPDTFRLTIESLARDAQKALADGVKGGGDAS